MNEEDEESWWDLYLDAADYVNMVGLFKGCNMWFDTPKSYLIITHGNIYLIRKHQEEEKK